MIIFNNFKVIKNIMNNYLHENLYKLNIYDYNFSMSSLKESQEEKNFIHIILVY